MNENKDIIVAMTGTVTITAEEYKELVVSRALLEAVLAHHRQNNSYRLDDMVSVVDAAMRTVITAPAATENGEQDA